MTVSELIHELSQHDPNRLVIMSKDAEGNGYSPLSHMWDGAYKARSTWSGEVGLEALTDEYVEHGYSEDNVIKGVPALILKPIN